MQYVGDAVMAVFGAPVPCTGSRRPRPAGGSCAMHAGARRGQCIDGEPRDSRQFGLGIGLSTGEVAAALLGSDERVEYTVVGDAVNLTPAAAAVRRAPGQTGAVAKRRGDMLIENTLRRRTAEPSQ